MRYKITNQYAQDIEKLIAEFHNIEDANFFLERKLIADNEKNIKLIYRLFDDQRFIRAYNMEKINCSIRPGQYADEDQFLPDAFGQYKVSRDNSPSNTFAAFVDLKDCELWVEDKLTHANDLNFYYIFKDDIKIAELNKRIKTISDSTEGSQGKGQTSSFRPTPLNTSPRPLGVPHSSLKDDSDDKKED